MFILFGTKTRAKVIEGGRRGRRRCSSCEETTDWVECLVKDSFNVFFIDVLDSSARCMRCCGCGDDCAIDDWDREQRRAQITAATPSVSPAIPSASAGNAPSPVPAKKSASAVDYDKEFAALKARLGKK